LQLAGITWMDPEDVASKFDVMDMDGSGYLSMSEVLSTGYRISELVHQMQEYASDVVKASGKDFMPQDKLSEQVFEAFVKKLRYGEELPAPIAFKSQPVFEWHFDCLYTVTFIAFLYGEDPGEFHVEFMGNDGKWEPYPQALVDKDGQYTELSWMRAELDNAAQYFAVLDPHIQAKQVRVSFKTEPWANLRSSHPSAITRFCSLRGFHAGTEGDGTDGRQRAGFSLTA